VYRDRSPCWGGSKVGGSLRANAREVLVGLLGRCWRRHNVPVHGCRARLSDRSLVRLLVRRREDGAPTTIGRWLGSVALGGPSNSPQGTSQPGWRRGGGRDVPTRVTSRTPTPPHRPVKGRVETLEGPGADLGCGRAQGACVCSGQEGRGVVAELRRRGVTPHQPCNPPVPEGLRAAPGRLLRWRTST